MYVKVSKLVVQFVLGRTFIWYHGEYLVDLLGNPRNFAFMPCSEF